MYSDNTEMIDRLKNKLNGIADETLGKIVESGTCGNHINVFRDCYDEFNRLLLIAKNNKTFSASNGVTGIGLIQDALRQDGILCANGEVLSADYIRNLLYRVRAERGLASKRPPAPTPTNPRAAAKRLIEDSRPPAAQTSKPASNPKSTVTPTVVQPSAPVVPPDVGDYVSPEPIRELWRPALERIKGSDKKDPWNGNDEYTLRGICERYMERRNKFDYVNMWDDYLSYPNRFKASPDLEKEKIALRYFRDKLNINKIFHLYANMGADDYVAP